MGTTKTGGSEPSERKTFADVLRGGMTENRLRQVEVAEAVGVTQSRVSRWLSKRGLPSDENLRALAQLLGRDYGRLRRIVDEDRAAAAANLDTRSMHDRLDALDVRLESLETMIKRVLKAVEPKRSRDNGPSRVG